MRHRGAGDDARAKAAHGEFTRRFRRGAFLERVSLALEHVKGKWFATAKEVGVFDERGPARESGAVRSEDAHAGRPTPVDRKYASTTRGPAHGTKGCAAGASATVASV